MQDKLSTFKEFGNDDQPDNQLNQTLVVDRDKTAKNCLAYICLLSSGTFKGAS